MWKCHLKYDQFYFHFQSMSIKTNYHTHELTSDKRTVFAMPQIVLIFNNETGMRDIYNFASPSTCIKG